MRHAEIKYSTQRGSPHDIHPGNVPSSGENLSKIPLRKSDTMDGSDRFGSAVGAKLETDNSGYTGGIRDPSGSSPDAA